jgi:branched-chain amino acid transport system permease protein
VEYILHVLVLVAIYSILSVSLDLLAGHTGLLSLTHAALFGIGSYSSALLTTRFGFSIFVGFLVGVCLAVLISFFISLPSLRLYDDYFVIATFGFQMILFNVLNNWIDVTHGPLGIVGVPRLSMFGWQSSSRAGLLLIVLALTAFAHLVVNRITSSPFGRVLRAIREDEIFARALGKRTTHFKVAAFALSAALAAAAGCLYAHYVTYVDPSSYTVMDSILVISMVIIGGAGSRWGPVMGALLLVTLPEALRFVGLTSVAAANLRQIIYGSLLVLMMIFRPKGIIGQYGFGRQV